MKIFLTGSNGFIGSTIFDHYYDQGHDIIGFDKVKTPAKDFLTAQRTHHADLRDITRENLIKLLDGVDVVNHHAAQIDVRKSIESPCDDAWMNIGMTIKLLECCVEAGVKRFIYASSGGAIDGSEFPTSPYGIAKLSSEKYIHFFNNYHKLETVVLRYSNAYGPRQKAGVVPIFVRKMLKNEPITINGGNQTRDFVFVGDMADANEIALTCKSGTYNISSGQSYDVNTLASLLKALTNSNSETIYNENIKGEIMESKLSPDSPDGWNASTILGEGLKQTIEYFKS